MAVTSRIAHQELGAKFIMHQLKQRWPDVEFRVGIFRNQYRLETMARIVVPMAVDCFGHHSVDVDFPVDEDGTILDCLIPDETIATIMLLLGR